MRGCGSETNLGQKEKPAEVVMLRRQPERTSDGDAPGMIRTCDLCLRRAALYPLSYGRVAVSVAGR
jgi:hypothetical protein